MLLGLYLQSLSLYYYFFFACIIKKPLSGIVRPPACCGVLTSVAFSILLSWFWLKGRPLSHGDPCQPASQGVLFSCSVVSDSLRPHESQHTRPPCPSPTPRACSNSCPWSQWCHPAISSSVILFSSCLESFPASGSFPMSQLFTSGGQSITVSVSSSVLPMNIQGWFPLGLTGLISLQSKGLSRVFSSTTVRKHEFSGAQPYLWSNSHICTWLWEKPFYVNKI